MIRVVASITLLVLSACEASTDSASPFISIITTYEERQISTKMWINQTVSQEVCTVYEGGPTQCLVQHRTTNKYEVRAVSGKALNEDDYPAVEAGIDAVCRKAGLGGRVGAVLHDQVEDGVFSVDMDCEDQPIQSQIKPAEE